MTTSPTSLQQLREALLSDPNLILEDIDLMRALVSASEDSHGSNVVDIRGVAMQRLEDRLGRLEDTHRSVIAAAYENLAGMTVVHRSVLRLLDATTFEDFLKALEFDVRDLMRVTRIRLILESHREADAAVLRPLGSVMSIAEPGFVDDYVTQGRDKPPRHVTLRQLDGNADAGLYARDAHRVASEACLRLDLGPGNLPGMIALGSDDPDHFAPNQGTDLLEFFGGAFERMLRRWLA